MPTVLRIFTLALGLATLFATCTVASAGISSNLLGDIRDENPDTINIGVTIDFPYPDGSNPMGSHWEVDLSPMLGVEPNAKLLGFYFNVALSQAELDVLEAYSQNDSNLVNSAAFSNVSPSDWVITLNVKEKNAQGSGKAQFDFISANEYKSGQIQFLEFDWQLQTGNWTEEIFTGAAISEGAAGSGQLGAHVGGLGAGANDSGFAFGGYFIPPEPFTAVPEPASLAIWGLGALALGGTAARRRRNRSA